jgi:large subunit ribosomal protein L7e
MHPAVRKTLYNLRLRKVFSAVFVKVNASVIEKLQRVEPYVTYGYPNLKNVKELIHKKGFGNVAKQRVPGYLLRITMLLSRHLGNMEFFA